MSLRITRDAIMGGYLVVKTSNYDSRVPLHVQIKILARTLFLIKPERDFLIFDPEATEGWVEEDEGRSLHLAEHELKGIEKVYAKLDDYGSVENLRENSGLDVNTRYAVTIMLASDY